MADCQYQETEKPRCLCVYVHTFIYSLDVFQAVPTAIYGIYKKVNLFCKECITLNLYFYILFEKSLH